MYFIAYEKKAVCSLLKKNSESILFYTLHPVPVGLKKKKLMTLLDASICLAVLRNEKFKMRSMIGTCMLITVSLVM